MNAGRNVCRAVVVLLGIQLFSFACTRLAAQEYRLRQIEPFSPPAAETNNFQAPASTPIPAEVVEPGLIGELGPQIVLQRRKPPLLTLESETQYLYSSNVGLTPHSPVSDGLLFETLGVSITPPVLQQFSPALYFRQQFVRYDTQSDLDFDAQTAGLSFDTAVKDWFNLYGGLSATRTYTEHSVDVKFNGEFYKEFDAQLGLYQSFIINRSASLYFGYQMDWLPASPSDLTEWDNAIYAGINLRLVDKLTAQLLARLRYRDYMQSSRVDTDYLLSAALRYTFNQYVSAGAYASYAYNDSNQSQFRYGVATLGGALDLSIRF